MSEHYHPRWHGLRTGRSSTDWGLVFPTWQSCRDWCEGINKGRSASGDSPVKCGMDCDRAYGFVRDEVVSA